MTKNEFLELKNKHSYKNQYKVKHEKELRELVKLAESIDVNMDLNWLDVSAIKNMCCLFQGSKFNGNISKWDVSNVTSMDSMFRGSEFNGDISKWNVSNVRSMDHMFAGSKFNGDISKWDVSNVRNMCCMFYDSKFNGRLPKWNVSNVKYASDFNPYLGINNKEDLEKYILFLNSIYNNKPIEGPIKEEWWKTRDIAAYVANKINKDPKFVNKIKKVICTGDTND